MTHCRAAVSTRNACWMLLSPRFTSEVSRIAMKVARHIAARTRALRVLVMKVRRLRAAADVHPSSNVHVNNGVPHISVGVETRGPQARDPRAQRRRHLLRQERGEAARPCTFRQIR